VPVLENEFRAVTLGHAVSVQCFAALEARRSLAPAIAEHKQVLVKMLTVARAQPGSNTSEDERKKR